MDATLVQAQQAIEEAQRTRWGWLHEPETLPGMYEGLYAECSGLPSVHS
jgi:hypothetical protein